MPQLDPNTFIYQYVGVITLLIVIYTILSYSVLPILLRLTLVRNFFVLAHQKLTDTSTTSVISRHVLLTKKPFYNSYLINKVLLGVTLYLKNIINFLNNNLLNVPSVNTFTLTNIAAGVLLSEFTTVYLILLLSDQDSENE